MSRHDQGTNQSSTDNNSSSFGYNQQPPLQIVTNIQVTINIGGQTNDRPAPPRQSNRRHASPRSLERSGAFARHSSRARGLTANQRGQERLDYQTESSECEDSFQRLQSQASASDQPEEIGLAPTQQQHVNDTVQNELDQCEITSTGSDPDDRASCTNSQQQAQLAPAAADRDIVPGTKYLHCFLLSEAGRKDSENEPIEPGPPNSSSLGASDNSGRYSCGCIHLHNVPRPNRWRPHPSCSIHSTRVPIELTAEEEELFQGVARVGKVQPSSYLEVFHFVKYGLGTRTLKPGPDY